MKKIIALVLALVMICALTGCGGTSDIGIIGGADGPTAMFLMQEMMRSPVFYAMIVSFLLLVGTGLALLIDPVVKFILKKKNSLMERKK